jgi:hypothetical protein
MYNTFPFSVAYLTFQGLFVEPRFIRLYPKISIWSSLTRISTTILPVHNSIEVGCAFFFPCRLFEILFRATFSEGMPSVRSPQLFADYENLLRYQP